MKTLARLLVLVALVVGVLPAVAAGAAAPAPAAAKSGRLLTEGGQLTSFADRSQVLPSTVWCRQAAFSPNGAMIATPKPGDYAFCETGPIRIFRAHGRTTTVAAPPGRIRTLSWSPDGRQLAVEVLKGQRQQIWLVKIDGSGRTLLHDAVRNSNDSMGQPSWSPDGSRIAAVGRSGANRSNNDQIYTIPVAGGPPVPYNVPYLDPTCQDVEADCHVVEYAQPRWAPDGSRLLVNVIDAVRTPLYGYVSATISVGTIAEGEGAAHLVRDLGTYDGSAAYGPATEAAVHPSLWSADGLSVLSRKADPGARSSQYRATYARTVIATGVTTPALVGEVYDWQPCPTGTCVAWPKARTPRVTMTVRRTPHTRTKYHVAGTVAPRQVGFVKVDLQALVSKHWVSQFSRLGATDGKLAWEVTGLTVRPRADRCRIVATYRRVVRKVEEVRC